MKRFLRGSSSRSSKEKQSEEAQRPKYNLPRTAEVRPCEWPCDAFLEAGGIYEDFYYLAGNAGITDFLYDKCDQYLLLTNTFVQKFHFHARRSPPTVEFHLYDEHKEMTLYDFCEVCKLPYEGSVDEPRPRDVEDFIDEVTIGEGTSITWYSATRLVRLLLCLHLLCSIFVQAGTLFCPRTFMHTGSGCDPQFLSQSHHLIHIRILFISGSHMSSLTSGTPRILLSTPKRATLIHGRRPT